MLIGDETECGRPWDLLEHTPARPDPQRAGATREHVTDRAYPRRFPGKRHRVPSGSVPRVQIPIDDGPDRSATVLDDRRHRLESLEARVVTLQLAVANSSDACRVGRADPETTLARDSQRLDRSADGCVAQAVPVEEAPPVEAQQAGIGANPEVALVSLCNRVDRSERAARAVVPGGKGVAGEYAVRRRGGGRHTHALPSKLSTSARRTSITTRTITEMPRSPRLSRLPNLG